MVSYLKNFEIPRYLTCPVGHPSKKTTLVVRATDLYCRVCKRKYRILNKIIEFVQSTGLDSETKRELEGNSYAITKSSVAHYANKDKWSDYYNHFVNQKFEFLLSFLNQISMRGVVSLGSGPGFELKEILKRKGVELVFSSDLAYAATAVVPTTLKDFNVKLCLFTSDLNHTPVIPNDNFPILIYEALHHTGDIHDTIERLMKRRFKNILFVEPTTNFLIKILARFGLAQRVEYSGLKPDFLDLGILKELAKKHKYKVRVHTLWDVPEDFFRVICKKGSIFEPFLLSLVELFSKMGDFFQFGSFSVVSLERIK